MKKIIFLIAVFAIGVMGANLAPGAVNKQMATNHEVNLGTMVYEQIIHKYQLKNLRPGGLNIGDVSEKATQISYNSCLAAQISEDIVKAYYGATMSEQQLLSVIGSRIPTNNVFHFVDNEKLMNDQERKAELGMALALNAKRNFTISGLRIGEAQIAQAKAQIEADKRLKIFENAPKTIDEALRMKDAMIDESFRFKNVLNVKNLREPNDPKIDSTGWLRGMYKTRFESTYFDIGDIDAKKTTPQGTVTAWQMQGGIPLPSNIDPNLVMYTKGSHRITMNGDLVVMGSNCVMNAQGDQVRLVCPNSTGEIFTGGGETGIYCGTKSSVSQNSSGQFQFLSPKLTGEK
jgi:hypothetical protein